MEYTYFSIDNWSDLRTLRKFLDYVDKLEVMGHFVGKVQINIGFYEGVPELSFTCLTVDYDKHIKGTEWLESQHYVLKVSSDLRQPVVSEHVSGGSGFSIGMVEKMEHPPTRNATYEPVSDIWWTTKGK